MFCKNLLTLFLEYVFKVKVNFKYFIGYLNSLVLVLQVVSSKRVFYVKFCGNPIKISTQIYSLLPKF